MTIDEAIKHAEEVASREREDCIKCAEEHRQLAGWLKDYKRLLEQEPKTGHWIHHSIAEGFKYERTPYECSCCNKFERETSNFCPNCGVKMEKEE